MKSKRSPTQSRKKQRAEESKDVGESSEFDALIEEGIKSEHVSLSNELLRGIWKRSRKRATEMRLERRIREALAEPEKSYTLKQFHEKMKAIAVEESKAPPPKVVRPRCKHVLVILQNCLEIVDLLREETFPPLPSDFPDDGSLEYAVVNYHTRYVAPLG